MTEKIFYSLVTNTGIQKINDALENGTKLDLKYIALGDSNGSYYEPDLNQTSLVNETYRAEISSVDGLTARARIPFDIGGFYIREAGIFDSDNNLILISKQPETYKPEEKEGGFKDIWMKIKLTGINPDALVLKIDPNIQLCTLEELNTLKDSLSKYQLLSEKGKENGYAPLDENGIVTFEYLPDDIANKSLSNLNTAGDNKIHASKMYLSGDTLSDTQGYNELLTLKNDTIFSKSIVDVAINNDYSISGTPSINQEIVSFPNGSSYIVTNWHLPNTRKSFTIKAKFVMGAETLTRSNHLFGAGYGGLAVQSDSKGYFTLYNYVENSSGSGQNIFMQLTGLAFEKGDTISIETGYKSKENVFYLKVTVNDNSKETSEDAADYWYKDPSASLLIGVQSSGYDSYYFDGTVDLSEFNVYEEGSLVYVPALYIPCTEHKNGAKIAESTYLRKVALFKEYKGYSPYFTLNETDKTFTLPMGELYGMLNKKANTELIPLKSLGEIITSAFPISDKNAVLLNGSIITAEDNYLDFVNLFKGFYNANNETLSCYSVTDSMSEEHRIYVKGSLWSGTKLYNADGTLYSGTEWTYKSSAIYYTDSLTESQTKASKNTEGNIILHNLPEFMTTEETWQSLNTANGECGKFVYDETANTVRIPNVKVFPSDGCSLGEYKYIVVSQLL